jgi:hypothetical protein
MKQLFKEIVGSQHHGSVGLGLLFEELPRCSLFNYFAQPHKLIYALIWLHVTPTFKIVHHRGADRAQNYLTLIEHREFNDHPIEVVAPHLASLQRHCKFSLLEGSQKAAIPTVSGPSPHRRRMFEPWTLAEGVGFEPTIRFPVYTLSKRAP